MNVVTVRKCGNYLRVRGEYPTFCRFWSKPMELPPRARRIPPLWEILSHQCWNYLRVRGEYVGFGGVGGGGL